MPARGQRALVVVDHGYHPSVVRVRAGAPFRLVFRRDESESCSEAVALPELGHFALLPEGREVVIDCGPLERGTYGFSCASGLLRGTLEVR